MFAINVRLTKKIRLCFVGLLLAMVVLFTCFAAFGNNAKQIICTDEQQVAAYINSFGLEVDSTNLKTDNIIVPLEFNEVYNNYNRIQQQQGFDLQSFKGKQLVRYTFPITNYPNQSEDVFAEVLTFKGVIVAADVYSTNIDGFISALK